ncbi:uncharacterized protein SPAR_H01390 [Saccharomyces paradoxus]|uniref:Uncharacterized protein n=1 Tax=Saccharomyces paradoxus TaxID=27291 RepID=A0A8B8USM6_SACPA|nr:uncharacterized protein SPAR_H01390 [Saccharomyces paradoxus]QHS73735.1 hypothetical protein SPAR_H01390 [Saccharomyces paradoxus]
MNQTGRTVGGSQNGVNAVVNPFRVSSSNDRVPSRDETPRNFSLFSLSNIDWDNPRLL